ncbi:MULTISPECIES: DUF2231 domain-containing protein [unclassified Caballeronia]|uniref:DUF2231 domain-containing protein n=1 Tax=unclassified Caballeronia TaxID=2646786 RepID=UPI001F14C4A7|nr:MULTISPECIES: DUF2231 domain-containing protein [unclassified Caballeronia]
MTINLTVVLLYAINIWLRTRDPTSMGPGMSTPVLLSIVGVALLFVSGWLGGENGAFLWRRRRRAGITAPGRRPPSLDLKPCKYQSVDIYLKHQLARRYVSICQQSSKSGGSNERTREQAQRAGPHQGRHALGSR